MMGKPAEALVKVSSGSREGTRRIWRPEPRQTRHIAWSPADSGTSVLLVSAYRLQAEILDVLAASRPAGSGSAERVPAIARPVSWRALAGFPESPYQHAQATFSTDRSGAPENLNKGHGPTFRPPVFSSSAGAVDRGHVRIIKSVACLRQGLQPGCWLGHQTCAAAGRALPLRLRLPRPGPAFPGP